MMKNYIHYAISYRRIRKIVLSYGYTLEECRSVLRQLRQMEPKVLQAFLHWVSTSEYPQGYLNEVSVRDLVELRNMAPPAAFLAADWMGRDPSAAAHFLTTGSKDFDTAMEPIEIPDDLKERVAALEAQAAAQTEDESDFGSPPQM